MNKVLRIAFALCILMQSGCASNRASFQSITDSGQSPELGFGHVAGMFSRDWCPAKLGVGLGIVNTATAEEYVLPFSAESTMPRIVTDELGLIQLPQGEYRVAYWVTYSTADHEQLTRTDISPDSAAAEPFTLAAGEVVFLGSHVASNGQKDGAGGGNQWSVRHQRLSLQTVQKVFSRSYPSFSTQPMLCPTCIK